MRIETLCRLNENNVIDYQTIYDYLKGYKYPRDKISKWLRDGDLIRIKKGLYIFGPNITLQPYSPELLANLIYGPSAISLTSALSHYGIIPEKVVTQTSITPNRNKRFETPVGTFTYHYLNIKKYSVGITQQQLSSKQFILIATPEKALADQLYLIDKTLKLKTKDDMKHYITDDLRCDDEQLEKFSLEKLKSLAKAYNHHHISLLYNYFQHRI